MLIDVEDNKVSEGLNELFLSHTKKALELRIQPIKKRIAHLKNLERWILNNRRKIQSAVFEDFRKAAEEVDLTEIYPVLVEIRHARKNLKFWSRPQKVNASLSYLGTSSHIQYEPKGVTLIISPWNYPFNLTIGPLVSAISAGNTAIIKPSEFTPKTSELIKLMLGEIFSEDLVAVCIGDYTVSEELMKLPFHHIFFTGSPKVGRIVMASAAKHLTSVTLELGGKSPVIISESASVKDAAEKIAWGKWINSGQTCVAPDYIYVHDNIKELFVKQLKKAAIKIYEKDSDYTGIVNETHFQRINMLGVDAINKGAILEYAGEVDKNERKIGPMILTNVAPDSLIMEEEIFGPILPIICFTNIDEVINQINENPKPLALYHFSNRNAEIAKIQSQTSSGSMCINDCTLQFAHPNLPFGGINNSGIGKAHGHHGFLTFSNEKAILRQRVGFTMAKTLYPPYGRVKKLILNVLLKYF